MVVNEMVVDRQAIQVTGWSTNATHTIFYLVGGGTHVVPNGQWTMTGGGNDDDLTNTAEDEKEKAQAKPILLWAS